MTKPTGIWRKFYSNGRTLVRQRKKTARVKRIVVIEDPPPVARAEPAKLDPMAQKLSNEFERLISARGRK